MKRIYIFSTALWMLLATSPVFAQSAEDIIRYTQRSPSLGTRTAGMAGVGRAGINDPVSLNLNPAGLGWMQNSYFSIGGSSQKISDVSNFVPSNTGNSTTLNRSGITDADYVRKVNVSQGSLVFGINWHQTNSFDRETNFMGTNSKSYLTDYFLPNNNDYTIDAGTDKIIGTSDDVHKFGNTISQIAFETYAIDFDKNLYAAQKYPYFGGMNRGTAAQSGYMSEKGSMRELNFGGAWEASKNVMVGLSVGINSGALTYRRSFDEVDKDNANDGVAKYTDTVTGEQLTVDFKSVNLTENLDATISGVKARFGVSTKLTENLKVGASVESPTQYGIEEDYATIIKTTFDTGDTYEYGGLTNDVGTDLVEYRMTTPWRIGGGAEFKVAGARLFGDVEYVDWSKMKVDSDYDRDYYASLTKSITQNYQPTMNLSVGGEYSLGAITVRGGWATQPDARKSPLDGKRDKQYMSAGAGLKLGEKYTLQFGFMRESYNDTYRPYSDLSSPNPSVFNDDSYVTRKITRDFMKFGLGIKL